MVNKIISYEQNTKDQSWFNRFIGIGGDTFPGRYSYEGELVIDLISNIMKPNGFQTTLLKTSDESYTIKQVNNELNKGAGFFSFSGHGFEIGMGTYPPDGNTLTTYRTVFTNGLQNRGKYPVMFLDACSCANIGFTLEEYLSLTIPFPGILTIIEKLGFPLNQLHPCFAWQLLKQPQSGSIASIGTTTLGYTWVNDTDTCGGASYLHKKFYESYQKDITLSEMFTGAQNLFLQSIGKECFVLEEFILLGDPTLKIGGY
jgi:hypothetical protein